MNLLDVRRYSAGMARIAGATNGTAALGLKASFDFLTNDGRSVGEPFAEILFVLVLHNCSFAVVDLRIQLAGTTVEIQ